MKVPSNTRKRTKKIREVDVTTHTSKKSPGSLNSLADPSSNSFSLAPVIETSAQSQSAPDRNEPPTAPNSMSHPQAVVTNQTEAPIRSAPDDHQAIALHVMSPQPEVKLGLSAPNLISHPTAHQSMSLPIPAPTKREPNNSSLSALNRSLNKDNQPFTFKHPFSMTIAGPSCSGKTTWIKQVLKSSDKYIEPTPQNIVWFYKRWQPMYTEMQETIPNIEFIQNIPMNLNDDSLFDTRHPTVIIFDDLMKDATKNTSVAELYTEGSHHRNLSVICLMQNLYHRGKENRTMSLNNQYLVLFKNPRDKLQMSVLARQMYPGNTQFFIDKFNQATTKPYGYLLVDLKQETPDSDRLRSDVISGDESYTQRQNVEVQPSCVYCNMVFHSPLDMHKHELTCCKNNKPTLRHEQMMEPFVQWMHDVKEENDGNWRDNIAKYMKTGYNQRDAEDKAEMELDDQKLFITKYKDLLSRLIALENSALHQSIVDAVEIYYGKTTLAEAVALALDEHWQHFQSMFHSNK